MKQLNLRIPTRILALVMGLFLSLGAVAQITVNGLVKDATGEGVIGASVRIVGTTQGTVTDFDGNFTLSNVPKGAKLLITSIGYQDQEVLAAEHLEIIMQDNTTTLNELVVIGYGVARKSDLTGSVTALKPDAKNKGVTVSAQDMLTGKVAGLNVTAGDGNVGGGATLRIRGGSSLNASNDPLIVLDGIALDNDGVAGMSNIISSINPADIESFNVLKDASATAIYGSRGSNGVIIITTKKGSRHGAPQVSYSGNVTFSKKKKNIEVMDGDEYRAFIKNIFGEDSTPYQLLGTANTNWQDLILRTAVSHDHNVTVSGAFGTVLPYRVSLGYTDQEGIIIKNDYKRATGAITLSPSLFNDHLNLVLNGKGMWTKRTDPNDGIGSAVWFDPTQDPYKFTSPVHTGMGLNENGTLRNFGGYFEWPTAGGALGDSTWPYTKHSNATSNPVAGIELANNRGWSRQFIGSADIDYKIHGLEDIRLHMTLGADIIKSYRRNDVDPASPGAMYYGSHGGEDVTRRNLQLSTYAQYFKDFNENNHFDVMAGYEWAHYRKWGTYDWWGYYAETNNDKSLAGKETEHVPNSYDNDHYLVSFFGRANYTLMNRYMLTATFREDGSSRFREHWAFFPSFAFAWKIKEENFLKGVDALSDLKLRLGWGKTGQQDGIGDYLWIPRYSKNTGVNSFYPLTGEGLTGDGHLYRPDDFRHDLKWETTTTTNIGIDWGVMNQRLTGSIDWYYRKTTDLLNTAPTPALSGFINEAMQNIGSMKNTGIELSIDWKAIQNNDWTWQLTYNFTYNKNEITDLSGVSDNGAPVPTGFGVGGTGTTAQANQVGYPAWSYYVYQQVYDANGRPIENLVVDRNGDGVISGDDRYLYKSPTPPVIMGFSSRLEWKNWDFGFNTHAHIGNYVYNNVVRGGVNHSPNAIWAQSAYLGNRPTATLAYGWQTDQMEAKLSDHWVQNGSFFKMDNITLGYTFSELFKTGSYKGLGGRIYGTVNNVFCITKYDGIDPEISSGNDDNLYPRPISFVLGLNLNF